MPTGRLTTHVLDTARGRPAAGLGIILFRLDDRGNRREIARAVTNVDGRCDAPLLAGNEFVPGIYELLFEAGTWFDAQGFDLPRPRFLDEIPIRFGISDPDVHYHVPLLLSPFAYSTYRGS